MSSGRTLAVPIALDGYGGIVASRPMRFDNAATLSIVTCMPSCTATGLRDSTSASRIVSGPRNLPSELSGEYVLPFGNTMLSAVSCSIVFAGMPCSSAVP